MKGIGIDIGTTAIKGLLFSEEGKVLHECYRHVETLMPRRGCYEQDPQKIFTAILEILQETGNHAQQNDWHVSFVSFSAYMHSLIAIDAQDRPLTNCLLWSDNRSQEVVQEYNRSGKGTKIYRKTGTPVHPMSPFYKTLFLRLKQQDIFEKSAKFVSIKAYIFFQLFKEYAVDYSIASASGMFNIFKLRWSREVLQELNINEKQLAVCYDSTHFFSGITSDYAKELSYFAKTKFVLGASDGCLANLGSRGIEENVGVISIGTSGAIRVTGSSPLIDERGRTFSYLLKKGFYVSGGAINNGGIVYEWFQKNFMNSQENSIDLLTNAAEGKGPLFLPFLAGERAPYWDSHLRGIYFGIDADHETKDFLRASLEGVCYAITNVYQVLQDVAGEVSVFYANGGFTRSKIWVQTLANVLQKKVVVSENYQAPALGAYMLGLLALGKYSSFQEMNFLLQDGETFLPQPQTKEIHQKRLSLYKKLVTANKELFKEME